MPPDPPIGLNERVVAAAVDGAGRCLSRLPKAATVCAAGVLGWLLWRCETRCPPPFPVLFPAGAPAALQGQLPAYFRRRAAALFNLIESLWGTPGRAPAGVSVTGWPAIADLQRRRVPVILLAGHFIDLPVGIRALAERVPIGLVARLFRHAALRGPLARLASRTGGKLVDGCDAREICRRLKHGETVVILADYPEPAGSPTATDRIERLARATRAVVLPLSCRRIDGRLSLAVGMPLGRSELNDEALRTLFAGWIAEAPIDYLWPRIAGGRPPGG
ncbi:MAG TPA: hypothetical protein PKE41_01150 [Candidatus Macondimonas sp.]|nr:hypothetical protein [Candidatus Macondimonas sp.]